MKYDKALATITTGLEPGEVILAHTRTSMRSAKHQTVKGALALTNRRIRFAGSTLQGHADASIKLSTITEVAGYRQGMLAFTTVTAAGKSHRFMELPREFLEDLELARAQDSPPAPDDVDQPVVGVAAPAISDQLAQLAGLHQNGLLTTEEFTAAKTRLLGLGS